MELLDRVVEDEERLAAVESRVEGGEEQEPESMDPKAEQWQGNLSWADWETETVADEIQKVDLASLTDWDE